MVLTLCSALLTEAGMGQMLIGESLLGHSEMEYVLVFCFSLFNFCSFCFKLIIDFYMVVFCVTWWCCAVGDCRFLVIGARDEEPVCHISC